MQYSPKLKRVMAQIKKLLNDNDIAGFVVIHTPGFSEYLTEISPSYSAAKFKNNGDGIEIKGKAEHYGGDKNKRNKKIADTANMFTHLTDITGQHALNFLKISEHVDIIYNAQHGDGDHTSSNQQNN